MTDNRVGAKSSVSGCVTPSLDLCSTGDVFDVSTSNGASSSAALCRLAILLERLVKLLAMLATLSFLIIELADARTRCSFRARPLIPGKGRTSRLQTSESRASSRILSARGGAKTGMRLDARRDCDRLIEALDVLWSIFLQAFVFLIMT
jgi:hypothetical protein